MNISINAIASCLIFLTSTALAADVETKFLLPGEVIFKADFDCGENPTKPSWQLRKSTWEIEAGVLKGVNTGGNGPFIRLLSKEKGGPLPEDYIMRFSFKIEENPKEKKSNKHDEKLSSGHRFSFGHYAAKYQWRADIGMDLAIGHGHPIEDATFHIEKSKWYRVTAEIRGDEILVWFKDGPAYYMQHNHFRSKPSGWEFFTHASEVGFLDSLQVWVLAEGQQSGWEKLKQEIASAKRSFLSSENPKFKSKNRSKLF